MSQAGANSGSGGGGGASSFVEDIGTATPSGGVIKFLGGAGITTSGSGNTITITNTSPETALTFHTDSGDASESGSAITMHGGSNINTSGASATVTYNLNSQVQQPNGTAGAPSYSFSAATDAGMYWDGSSKLCFSTSGFNVLTFDNSNMSISAGNTYIQNITMQSGLVLQVTAPGAYPYAVLATDYYIRVDTTSSRTINLPNAPSTNRAYVIKDTTGSAGTNNITVTTPGGVVTIDGSTSYVMNVNYGSAQFLFNGTSYEVF